MKELVQWIWNLPMEYILWPMLIFTVVVAATAGYIQYRAWRRIQERHKEHDEMKKRVTSRLGNARDRIFDS